MINFPHGIRCGEKSFLWRNFSTWEMWRQICFVANFAVLLPSTLFCRKIHLIAIYSLLRGEKFNQKLCLWRKKDKPALRAQHSFYICICIGTELETLLQWISQWQSGAQWRECQCMHCSAMEPNQIFKTTQKHELSILIHHIAVKYIGTLLQCNYIHCSKLDCRGDICPWWVKDYYRLQKMYTW